MIGWAGAHSFGQAGGGRRTLFLPAGEAPRHWEDGRTAPRKRATCKSPYLTRHLTSLLVVTNSAIFAGTNGWTGGLQGLSKTIDVFVPSKDPL